MSSPSSSNSDPLSDKRPDDRHFRTEHLLTDLGGRTARGGAVTLIAQGFKFFFSIAVTMVLGRLLLPQDYGLIGMVGVLIGFVSLFKDMGLAAATVQQPTINDRQVSTLFWINVLLSVALAVGAATMAPVVAWFYGEPKLKWITVAYASGFVISGLAVQHEALIRRQMRFGTLSTIEILSLLASAVTAIFWAWYGLGYWALVLSQLAAALVTTTAIWLTCGWRPGPPGRHTGVKEMLRFGGNFTGFSIVNFFARNLDSLLIGRFWGPRQLGLYTRAYQLLLLPIDQINSPVSAVAVPALSRLTGEPARYRQAYLRILSKVAIVTMPGMALMIGTADWMVRIVLGPQWTEVSRIFVLLGLVGMIQPICNSTGWLFITQNRTNDMFRLSLVTGTATILAIIVGLPWGAVGVATSYAAIGLCSAPFLFWFVGRKGPVAPSDFYRTFLAPLFASACGFIVVILFRRLSHINNPLIGLTLAFIICMATTLVVLWLIPAGRRAIQDFIPMLSMLRRKKDQVAGIDDGKVFYRNAGLNGK